MKIPDSTKTHRTTLVEYGNRSQPQQTTTQHRTPRPATHPTFSYPPTLQSFFTDDTDDDQGSQQEPNRIRQPSPDALTSSTCNACGDCISCNACGDCISCNACWGLQLLKRLWGLQQLQLLQRLQLLQQLQRLQ
jgi:hypothetical protein